VVSPATDEGGAADILEIDDTADPSGDTVLVTSTTMDGLTGEGPVSPVNII